MPSGGSVYSAYRTKPGTALGGRTERSRAGRATKDRDDEDRLLEMLLDMDEEQLNQIMQSEDETSARLLKGLDERGYDQDSIKHMKMLREVGHKSEKRGTATDAVFSSAAANNYYQAIGYRMGISLTSNDNDDGSSKNISWKGLKEDDSVDMSTLKSEDKSTVKSTGSSKSEGNSVKKVTSLHELMAYLANNDNDDVSSKNISWKGLKEDDSVDMSTLKSEDKSTMKNTGSSRSEGSSVKSITSLHEIMAYAMEKGKSPEEVAEYLMNADKAKKEVDKRRTEKLLAEALKKNKTPTEIANFLMKAEEAKRKEEEEKKAQKSTEKLLAKALKKSKTPAEVAEYLLKSEEEKNASKERKMNEQLVKDALKRGGKTPAEIAAYLLDVEQEKKAEELVFQALKVCKSPKEIADYLMKAEKEKQVEDGTRREQESAEKLVKEALEKGKTMSGVAASLLNAEQEKNRIVSEKEESQARPRSNANTKSSPPPPVKSLGYHRLDCELSTTSSVTNHLKSVPSIASVLSSECSVVTEIDTSNVNDSSSATSKKKEYKSSTSSLRSMKSYFSKKEGVVLQNQDGVQDTSKMAATPETPKTVVVDKTDDGEAVLNDSQSSIGGRRFKKKLAATPETPKKVVVDKKDDGEAVLNDAQSFFGGRRSNKTATPATPKKVVVDKKNDGEAILNDSQSSIGSLRNDSDEELVDHVELYAKLVLPEKLGSEKSVPVTDEEDSTKDSTIPSIKDDLTEDGTTIEDSTEESSCSGVEVEFVDSSRIKLAGSNGKKQEITLVDIQEHRDVSLNDYDSIATTDSSPKKRTKVSKAKSGLRAMSPFKKDEVLREDGNPDTIKKDGVSNKSKIDIPRPVPSKELPPRVSSRSVASSPPKAGSHSVGKDSVSKKSLKMDIPPPVPSKELPPRISSRSVASSPPKAGSHSVGKDGVSKKSLKMDTPPPVPSKELPPRVSSRSAASGPPPKADSHSVSEESSRLWDGIEEKDEAAKSKKGKLKRIMSFKKKSSPKKIVDNKTTKSSPKEIVDDKTVKTSPKKVADNKKKFADEDTSAGTEDTEIKSGASAESVSVKTDYVKAKAADKDQNSEWFTDGPVTSINLVGSDLGSDDGVSLPSVLRRASKVRIWDEPSVLKKWWSEASHPDDESSTYSRGGNSAYSGDSVSFLDDDLIEQGCINVVKDFATEAKGYKDEIALIAREFRDFCAATASSTEGGLKSVRQQASHMLGCGSGPADSLRGLSSEKTNHLAGIMQTKVKGGDDEQKEAVAIEVVPAMSDNHASGSLVRSGTDASKKRKLYLSKLRKVSLDHI